MENFEEDHYDEKDMDDPDALPEITDEDLKNQKDED
jgi:hypothetical protein